MRRSPNLRTRSSPHLAATILQLLLSSQYSVLMMKGAMLMMATT